MIFRPIDLLPNSLERWAGLAGSVLLAAGASFLLGQCDGARDERAEWKARAAEASLEAVERDGAAKEAAAEERLQDERTLTQREQEMRDAIADAPDPGLALRCQRLRNNGYREADLPPICGRASGNGSQAGAGGGNGD